LQDFKLAHLSVTFLQLIFNLVMLLLFSISVLLIYSLLMLSVESKSFEFGVMRMVGLSKFHVIILVIMQSFLFVIPSIIAGFISSFGFLQLAKWYADTRLQMEFEAIPSTGNIIQALVLSTLIPLLSSILPIQVVLDRNLNDALDIQRSKTQAVYVNILNKKKANLTPMVLFGLAITLYGVTIYYLLPLALLSMNLSLVS
jgi:ABC-type antimicrobial peptide transport system permease subunit